MNLIGLGGGGHYCFWKDSVEASHILVFLVGLPPSGVHSLLEIWLLNVHSSCYSFKQDRKLWIVFCFIIWRENQVLNFVVLAAFADLKHAQRLFIYSSIRWSYIGVFFYFSGLLLCLRMRRVRSERASSEMWKVFSLLLLYKYIYIFLFLLLLLLLLSLWFLSWHIWCFT